MWKSNLITAMRVLARNRAITLINVIGLSAALAVTILCLLFVRYETSFDTWHERGERIFAVYFESLEPHSGPDRNSTLVRPRLAELLRTTLAGIRESVLMHRTFAQVSYGDAVFMKSVLAVDPAFLSMFTLPLAAGDAATALQAPHSVVLDHETARKYFGPDVPLHAMLGEPIRLRALQTQIEVERTITGVLAPLPGPSLLPLQVLVSSSAVEELQVLQDTDGFFSVRGINGLFIELEGGVAPAEMEARLAALADEHQSPGTKARAKLQPFRGSRFAQEIRSPIPMGAGTPVHCYLLAGLAAVVLLIAGINFVNLALSRAISRTLEIGMRKVVGATRPQLASQFLAEAVVVSLIAVVGGMALAEVLLPTFNQVVRRQLDLDWLSLETGAGALTMALTVGLLSALYPARVISRYHPIRALGGSAPQFGRGRIGRGLIVLQFVMSTFLVVVTITMTRQLDFMHTNLGFDGERVVVAFSKDDLDPLQIGRVASEIDSRPGLVEGVAGIFVPPGMGGESPRPFRLGENTITIKPFRVTPDLPHVMGVEILSGTGFARDVRGPSPGILLNETAARLLGPGDPVGRVLSDPFAPDEPMPIIGVVADFHYEDMRHTVGPALLAAAMPGSSRPDGFSHILFRVDNQDRPAAVEEVRTLWNRMLPEYELQRLWFLDERFAWNYGTERRAGIVMKWMSACALAISCMGLVGLAALAAARRTREIGIRKVLGATTANVVLLMSRQFGWLVLAANVIAWPLAFVVLDHWLAFYAYRIDQGPGWFALAGAGVLVVALGTVSGQTWLAARTNPADALRYE